MAGATGLPEHPLIRALLAEAHRYSFFQAVSLIERGNPDAAPVGGAGPAAAEAIRFRPDVSMGFAPSSLAGVEWIADPQGPEGAGRFQITATFLGLYGTQSPLPNHWSEEILREVADDTTVRDFLDIFHHRVYSFFYRAWSKYRFHIQHRADAGDSFTPRLFALIGLRHREVRGASRLPAVRLLRYSGILLQRPRSAAALRGFVSDWFGGVSCRVTACTARRVRIAPPNRSRLGRGPTTLGSDLLLGADVLDRTGGFRMTLGPVGFATYLRFLPDGADHATLREMCDLFTGGSLEADLEVVVHGSDVPTAQLVSDNSPRLGWTSWLHSDAPRDASVFFQLREAA